MANGRRTRQPMWTAFQPGVLCHPVEIRRQSRNGGELEAPVAYVESRRCLKREERATWLPKIKVKGSGQECPLYTTSKSRAADEEGPLYTTSVECYMQLAGGGARPTQNPRLVGARRFVLTYRRTPRPAVEARAGIPRTESQIRERGERESTPTSEPAPHGA